MAPSRKAAENGAETALSIGAPNAGRLVRGERLESSSVIRILPAWQHPDYRWGLPQLVQLVERSAKEVEKYHGPSRMTVGDISQKTGGKLRKHASHQSGRDVDIAFYMTDRSGKPMVHHTFVRFDENGRAPELSAARFDDARNWTLIEALLRDSTAEVQHIFVSNELRNRLLREAEKRNIPEQLRLQAARVMSQPRGSSPHADHFHVRIACPRNQNGVCEPWPRMRSPMPEPTLEKRKAKDKRRRGGTEG